MEHGTKGLFMTIANRIKRLRQERGWSQAQLGQRLGVHQKQISGYERGVHVPSADMLAKISEVFDVSLDYLILGGQTGGRRLEVGDRELLRQMEEIDKLPEEEKSAIKTVLETFILKHRFQQVANEASTR